MIDSSELRRADEDAAAIAEVRKGLGDATAKRDVAEVVSFFTEDARYMRPEEPDDVGREAIGRHWRERLEELEIRLDYGAEETVVSGSLAYVRGVVNFRGTPRAGGEDVVLRNRYLWILRRGDDGVWRIARYIRNFLE